MNDFLNPLRVHPSAKRLQRARCRHGRRNTKSLRYRPACGRGTRYRAFVHALVRAAAIDAGQWVAFVD